jgi:hypothetical protein
MIVRVLTLRVEQTPSRNAYLASIEELSLSTVAVTANDALFVLGQCISSLVESCRAANKDVLDIIPNGEHRHGK